MDNLDWSDIKDFGKEVLSKGYENVINERLGYPPLQTYGKKNDANGNVGSLLNQERYKFNLLNDLQVNWFTYVIIIGVVVALVALIKKR